MGQMTIYIQASSSTLALAPTVARKETEAKKSELWLGPRSNWIVTVHQDESVRRAPEQT